jgi:hypothetical protein
MAPFCLGLASKFPLHPKSLVWARLSAAPQSSSYGCVASRGGYMDSLPHDVCRGDGVVLSPYFFAAVFVEVGEPVSSPHIVR